MRHLISYLLFVGIPFAGLLGILRVGQAVRAPAAVHGAYAVEPMATPGLVCQRYLLSGGDSTITLTQSGSQLTATLGPAGEVTMIGRLSGDELALEGVIQPASTPRYVACPVGDTLRITAKVHREAQRKRLDARLWSTGCRECEGLSFVAARPRHYERPRHS